MKLYHRTTGSIACLILRSGFVNRANRFNSDFGPEGVWFSDQPPNDIDRESDDPVISVTLKISGKALSAFEQPNKANYREWLIPTKVVSESVTAVKIRSGEASQTPSRQHAATLSRMQAVPLTLQAELPSVGFA